MSARQDNYELMNRLSVAGIDATYEQANTLRRAEKTLRTWAEQECGDSSEHASFSIERDEETGTPYRCVYPHDTNKVRRTRTPDLEAGALKRVKEVCATLGLHFFHQTDPRGACLYVSREMLTDSNYNRGVCCAI